MKLELTCEAQTSDEEIHLLLSCTRRPRVDTPSPTAALLLCASQLRQRDTGTERSLSLTGPAWEERGAGGKSNALPTGLLRTDVVFKGLIYSQNLLSNA